MILGVDEVGRGPWAGPLVVGAVVLDEPIDGLTDSKKLTKKKREQLDAVIRTTAVAHALGWVWPDEIDANGLGAALKLATIRAVEQIAVPYHEIIIDGTINFLAGTKKGQYVTTLAKADLLIPSVSAASILAKVARDNYMQEQHTIYPAYSFHKHVGYGTAAHRQAIEMHGVTPLHRLSFAPLAAYRPQQVTTKQIGNAGEDIAAAWLTTQGFHVIERNWRTRWCEIDIIAQREHTLYFVEVKHRRTAEAGGGIAAITNAKLRQMHLAAQFYLSSHAGNTARLAVITTMGSPPRFEQFLEIE